jgi:sporulation protein YqfD
VLTGDREVRAVLSDIGVTEGTPKAKLDTKTLADALAAQIPAAAFVSVQLRGTACIITVTEADMPERPPEEGTSADITASADCRITRLLVIAGTPLVKSGDAVKKGDVIVAGYKLTLDNDGQEVRVDIKAEADVFAEVWHYCTVFFAPDRVEYKRTGRYVDNNVLKLGSFVLPHKYKPSGYAYSETETDTRVCFGNLFVGMTVTRSRTFELEACKGGGFETERPALESRARSGAVEKAGGAVITDITYSVTESEGYIRLTAAARTEVLVSERK